MLSKVVRRSVASVLCFMSVGAFSICGSGLKNPAPHLTVHTTDIPKNINNYVYKVAKQHGYEVSVLKAIIEIETHWNTKSVSRAGSYGLCQIHKSNFGWLKKSLKKKYKKFDVFNPYVNIDCMMLILNDIRARYRHETGRQVQFNELFISYNRGINSAKRYIASRGGGFNYFYYRKTMRYLKEYRTWETYLRRSKNEQTTKKKICTTRQTNRNAKVIRK